MKIKLSQAYSFILKGTRDNQEDSRFPDTDLPQLDQNFFIVCDGVGGHDMGEMASSLVCQSMSAMLAKRDWNENFSNADFGHVLDTAYNELDANAHKSNCNMATTLVMAAFHGEGMTLAHIGDSRIYHIRPEEGIIYRSDDHSMVNSMVHSGMITPDEATNDSRRHIITRYMSPTDIDQTRCMATVLRTTDIKAGDYIFLCSDGVLQEVDDDSLLDIISNEESDEAIINQIKNRCCNSSDNSTATLIHVESVERNSQYSETNMGDSRNTAYYDYNEDGTVNIASTTRTIGLKKKGISDLLRRIFS